MAAGCGLPRLPSGRQPLAESFATGLGINLLNPKVVLFFVTFLPQFVDAHDPAATGKLFFLGAEFVVLSIPLAVAHGFCCRLAGRLRSAAPSGWSGR